MCSIVKFLILFLFTSISSFSQIFPIDTISYHGNRSNRINIAYLPDGYQSNELTLFKANATSINNALFNTPPFLQYKNFFNSFSVKVPSNGSGAIHNGTANDEQLLGGVPVQPIINPDNYFKSSFDVNNIHRLLYPLNSSAIFNVLANNIPDYDQSFIVVNSPYYGGAGGTFATVSRDVSSNEIAIHEIGHSFAQLGDEYWINTNYASEKPNMTSNNNSNSIKWKNWLGINNVGIFPYTSSGAGASWFKPHQNCKMQSLGKPFCQVCSERLVDKIHLLVNMIDSFSPISNNISLSSTSATQVFSIQTISLNGLNSEIKWYLNDTLLATNVLSIQLYDSMLTQSVNTVKVQVVDLSPFSKSYLPNAGYINTITWSVNKFSSVLPVKINNFSGKVTDKGNNLYWQIVNSEKQNKIIIERSIDGKMFKKIGVSLLESNKQEYSFTDNNPFTPFTYYRLQINDWNGEKSYSQTIRLQNQINKFFYKVYQNPELHKYHLSISNLNKQTVSLKIVNEIGNIILQKHFGKQDSTLEYNLDIASQSAGVYYLILTVENIHHNIQLIAK